MKKKFLWLLLFSTIIYSCNNDDGVSVALQNEANEFVWFGMNAYYYWSEDVEDLSIEKYPTFNDLYGFLNGFNDPEDLFDDLLIQGDQFSFMVDDYEVLEQSFQGVSKSYGFNPGLVRIDGSSELFGYVRYIIPDGPADLAGLKRGDIFTKIDGQQITEDNVSELLFRSEAMTIEMAEIVNSTITALDQEVSLTAVELTENPLFLSDIIEVDGAKVGYLLYNQFVNNNTYHEQLNEVFGNFKSNDINDLVLDLRYNPGGSVNTSIILASLIYGAGNTNTVYGRTRYNPQFEEALQNNGFDLNEYFTDVILNTSTSLNRLSLNRIFILTSGSTASASELIIAGLEPYIDVTLIGSRTVGKNLGSATLYDSPNFQKTPDNSTVNHTNSRYAMQPIISRFTNIDDLDYGGGFAPDVEISEVSSLESLPALGDVNDPLLAEALAIITGAARVEKPADNRMRLVQDDRAMNSVLIDNGDINKVFSDIVRNR